MRFVSRVIGCVMCFSASQVLAESSQNEHSTRLLWGDTHLHTSYSFDAYLFQNRTTDPDTAYRYAKGLPVVHPFHKSRVQRNRPLDFLVVSDHAELTTIPMRLAAGDVDVLATEFGRYALPMMQQGKSAEVFSRLVSSAATGDDSMVDELQSEAIRRSPWSTTAAIADQHNQPGVFTALIGWEWSALPNGANLHRVVFMDGDQNTASQFLPFSSIDSVNPEDLWIWLDQIQPSVGAEFVSIPHNMNLSKGRTFEMSQFDGSPITAEYARLRSRWETVAEVTQTKGDSETHPLLSPNDEFADFETYEVLIGGLDSEANIDLSGNYARGGLLNGLEVAHQLDVNPFAFGMIGATDSHTALSSSEENNFHGKQATDSTPERKLIPRNGRRGWDMSASGIAAVWAKDNTREAIVAAFKSKEVYATTGSRIGLRVFAGWDFTEDDLASVDYVARGYARGVPMGGSLSSEGRGTPVLMIDAQRDPESGGLDRIQVVKGFMNEQGEAEERIYDIDGGSLRARHADGSFESLPSTVDISTATYDRTQGSGQLKTLWIDQDYEPGQRAFYYVRVLEVPTPRHSLYDAVALQIESPDEYPESIQERAYSSPIWVTP